MQTLGLIEKNKMNNKDFIKKFVNSLKIEENRYSCLLIALQDARIITGRDIKNGNIKNEILESEQHFLNPHSFIGIINYLLVLELIGEIFKTKTFSTKKKNNIYKALMQFHATINEKDIDTIIALRNSLAHNYGLINIPHNSKEDDTKLHKFTLLNTPNTNLIEYPERKWSKQYSDHSEETSTKISVIKLQNLVESTYNNLKTEINNDNATISLSGIDELKSRFTIKY